MTHLGAIAQNIQNSKLTSNVPEHSGARFPMHVQLDFGHLSFRVVIIWALGSLVSSEVHDSCWSEPILLRSNIQRGTLDLFSQWSHKRFSLGGRAATRIATSGWQWLQAIGMAWNVPFIHLCKDWNVSLSWLLLKRLWIICRQGVISRTSRWCSKSGKR